MAYPDSTTQVGIVGAGPAGLLISHLLRRAGIASVIVEIRDREYTVQRVRAGVLEQGSVELLRDLGLGERLDREGLRHDGIILQFAGERHRVHFDALVGRSVWIYGQQEVVKDLLAAHDAAGTDIRYGVEQVQLDGLESETPSIGYTLDGEQVRIQCDLIVGADGYHGVSRVSIPESHLTVLERDYPFAWLGILAEVAPSTDELIYALHERGFAMHSMRSPEISRLYLQVDPHESLADWPDERIWEELDLRLGVPGWSLQRGPVLDRSITPMRAMVASTMRHGRLFLAGDAAHIVPPTGAKGLNLAITDVSLLSAAIERWFRDGDERGLDEYSARALKRVWQIQHFSALMTRMLHIMPAEGGAAVGFDRGLQLGQLSQLVNSRHGMAHLAEFYTGLPAS